MMSVRKGSKAKIYVNGQLIGEFSDVTVTTMGKYRPIYEIHSDAPMSRFPHHKCNSCGNEWTLSTDDSTCMDCKSENIDHGEM